MQVFRKILFGKISGLMTNYVGNLGKSVYITMNYVIYTGHVILSY